MTSRVGQQPVQHRTERRDSGAGGDEQGIAQRRPQDKVAEWSLAADFFILFHVAKKIRHEAVLHPVQTESQSVVLSGRGSDGISAGNLFAVGLVGLKGEPLAGDEAETRLAADTSNSRWLVSGDREMERASLVAKV